MGSIEKPDYICKVRNVQKMLYELRDDNRVRMEGGANKARWFLA